MRVLVRHNRQTEHHPEMQARSSHRRPMRPLGSWMPIWRCRNIGRLRQMLWTHHWPTEVQGQHGLDGVQSGQIATTAICWAKLPASGRAEGQVNVFILNQKCLEMHVYIYNPLGGSSRLERLPSPRCVVVQIDVPTQRGTIITKLMKQCQTMCPPESGATKIQATPAKTTRRL